ncbi:MAG: electron transport complex subunit E [Gammaproteobacteria bacterium]|jgi:electron transport complex protein RnfE|nr:electron transport complex subunit E [Gammaproteobacteria bacterium]
MSEPAYTHILKEGLWANNPGLVQLLGLCPLLAVTTNAINGLGLGLATLLTLTASNVTVSLIRNLVRPEVRIPVFVLVIASIVTVIELAMNAWLHELYLILGIFIPLIVTNCSIIGRAESFASRHSVDRALLDGLAMGAGFTLVLFTLGGLRELVGQGTLLSQAHLMFGEQGRLLTLTVIDNYRGFLLAILPPGAFLGLGFLIAGMNIINARRARKAAAKAVPLGQPSRA